MALQPLTHSFKLRVHNIISSVLGGQRFMNKNCNLVFPLQNPKPLSTCAKYHSSRHFNILVLGLKRYGSRTILRTMSSDRHRHFLDVPVSLSRQTRYLKGNVIDGKTIANDIKQEIKSEIQKIISSGTSQRLPQLSVLLIGNDAASSVYVRNKAKAAEETGISCDVFRLSEEISEEDVIEQVQILNGDSSVDGILVQLPLPEHINERTICDAVLPQKDVDGFHVLNVGRFCVDQEAFIPATPSGVLEIIRRLKLETKGKSAVVCGRSKNVGLPVALHLHSNGKDCEAGDATTTICHRHTPPDILKFQTQNADILVTATGVPGLITADMVKEGAVVIDIGITRILNEQGKYRLVGDVDFEGVREKAGLITPVPGGVGPVTVAMVLKNTLEVGISIDNVFDHRKILSMVIRFYEVLKRRQQS